MTTPSEALRAMADAIDANKDRPFGGCMVICPPDGTVIDELLIGASKDPGKFWGLLKATVDIALREQAEAERQGLAFGRR
jgi:hypothetical protein